MTYNNVMTLNIWSRQEVARWSIAHTGYIQHIKIDNMYYGGGGYSPILSFHLFQFIWCYNTKKVWNSHANITLHVITDWFWGSLNNIKETSEATIFFILNRPETVSINNVSIATYNMQQFIRFVVVEIHVDILLID